MKTLFLALFAVLSVTSSANAESPKERFERIESERRHAAGNHAYRTFILTAMKLRGVETSNSYSHFVYDGVDETYLFVSNGKAVCRFEQELFFRLVSSLEYGLGPSAQDKQTAFDTMRCVVITKAGKTPIESWNLTLELEAKNAFLAEARAAITKVGFDANQFAIPDDEATRNNIRSNSWSGFAGKPLLLESSSTLCKISDLNGTLSARCLKK